MAGLASLFRPSSIAVVGASERAGSRGAELLDNLRSVGFAGAVYPINPNRQTVDGLRSFARLSDVPAPIETVAICVDRDSALAAVRDAVGLGVRAILVLGTGYAEAGGEGARVQGEMADLCRDAGVTLVGPNCLGSWSRLDSVSYWLAPGSSLPLSGIGLVAQSGALASALMEPLSYRGIALDAVATTGNEAGTGVADFVAHFAEDPRINVIGLILESIRAPQQLLAAIRTARSHGKALACLLLGTSEAGRSAALAHTAALVGAGDVARANLTESGALLVDDLAELTEHLVLFSRYPQGLREGLAVTTVSGGGSGLVADLADSAGVPLAALQPGTTNAISGLLLGKSVGNPVDVALAGDVPGVYLDSVAALAADPNVGTVAIGLNLPHAADPVGAQFYAGQVEAAQAALAAGRDAVAFALVPGEPDPAVRAASERAGVPLLLGGREALRAIASATAFRADAPSPAAATTPPAQPAAATRLIGDPAGWDEFEVRAAMASFGIPVVAEALTHSADEAGAAAERVGFPVALKVVATNLAHKSDHGGVRLGLTDPVAVASAYRELARVGGGLDGVEFRGVAVQAMLPSGTELILGARSDAVFGRALVLGWGGLWTESFPSPQVTPIPVSAASAWTVIERLFGAALPRARRIADLESLHATVLAFSAFVSELPETVDVVEINPLILTSGRPGRVTAIDATVRGVVDSAPAPAQRAAVSP
ncbi:MAG: hypothetical protein QOH14_3662 [Pseudonocardiales bacterium]|nr:hypothetical protein [Pseudonocardiales bacterium]